MTEGSDNSLELINSFQKNSITLAHFRKNVYLCSVQWNEGLLESSSFSFLITQMYMIDKNVVETIVEEWLQTGDYFLVDINVSPDHRIVVEIDHADGVWIEDCAELSRFVQDRLGEELDDYELEVGSAGLGQPFKVARQYVNHIGKDVEVLTAEGRKVQGVLKAVDGTAFTVTVREKQKVEGKKRPVMADVDYDYDINNVKYTKYLLSFK